VFDSGVGGLSILKALRAELPQEDFVYVSDSGYAPYGERTDAHVIGRTRSITACLLAQYHIKALVVACNTATAAAIELLRQDYPELAIIGVEPALKPALVQSQTRRIGVLATRGTLHSVKFLALLATLAEQADFVCQACDGLADAIECQDTPRVKALCQSYTSALGPFGLQAGQIDTLVLGCTHYPFASEQLTELLGAGIKLISNGEPVARQTRRLLHGLASAERPGQCLLLSTGASNRLEFAAQNWLGLYGAVIPMSASIWQ
jgi:glutamate racemase